MARQNRFERALIRRRNKIEKRGQKLAFNALKKQYKAIFDKVGILSPESILNNLNQFVQEKPMTAFMMDYYEQFGEIGVMYRTEAKKQKSIEDEYFDDKFTQRLRQFALVETGAKVTGITATTEGFIRGAIESAVLEGTEGGWGVDEISRQIRKNLTDSLGDIGVSRAKTIARTEMTVGSNTASQYGIESTGLAYRKFWSTSGLKNIRDSHIFAEENYPKGVGQNEYFDMGNGNRMFYVGDPKGVAAEVVNCRCTTLYKVL